MSGTVNPPLLSPDRAGQLLEEVVCERVLGFVDFGALLEFEQELWAAFEACGVAEEDVAALVQQMIDRALRRIADVQRPSAVVGRPFTCPLAPDPFGPCELCDEESQASPPPTKRRAS